MCAVVGVATDVGFAVAEEDGLAVPGSDVGFEEGNIVGSIVDDV